MSRLTDQHYLRQQQYKTPANLEARIALHRKFGTTDENWFRWVFERISPQPGDQVLEIGCGPGDLWRENLNSPTRATGVTLGDLSAGMLVQARKKLPPGDFYRYVVLDAQAIPFPEAAFDIVVANHMLYHVPDITLALQEIRRVLKPGGRLLAATNGTDHMAQLDDLIFSHAPEAGGLRSGARRFSLENGADILKPYFPKARIDIFLNDLKVTDAEALVAYIRSSWSIFNDSCDDTRMGIIRDKVQAEIDTHGYFFITKSQGIIMASRPLDTE